MACQLSSFMSNLMFRCPCLKHKNQTFLDDVKLDLYCRGFVLGYWFWISHGEYELYTNLQYGPSITSRTLEDDQINRMYEELIFDATCQTIREHIDVLRIKIGRKIDFTVDDHPQSSLLVFNNNGKPNGRCITRFLNDLEIRTTKLYVLLNCEEVQPLLE
ncbi:hypothetical protein M5K25_018423 [Dendrobium thyrsiflorum]|uniref:Transposase-associated domain-containing protein n=1 Tax=Dendrobium thyrsiflorum TaxID=117978 RepID=A0ABD0UIA1_DENTH